MLIIEDLGAKSDLAAEGIRMLNHRRLNLNLRPSGNEP
jgi:hypothetical protein